MIARLVDANPVSPFVRQFVFEVPETEKFSFTPGQFVCFTGVFGGKKILRSYSITTPPGDNRFGICLNRVEDGLFSPHLFSLALGDAVEIRKPMGYFVLRDPARDCVFVATGTGIAPIRSMLFTYLGNGATGRMTLLFGVRHEEDILFREEFEELERAYSNFHFWPTLTRPGPEWRGRTGRVQKHLEEATAGAKNADVYICGAKAMVDEVRAELKDLGVPREQVIYEKFD